MTGSSRGSRRAIRPPTNAPVGHGADLGPGGDFSVVTGDPEEGATGPSGTTGGLKGPGGTSGRDEQWWHEQRPPHWE